MEDSKRAVISYGTKVDSLQEAQAKSQVRRNNFIKNRVARKLADKRSGSLVDRRQYSYIWRDRRDIL